MLRLTTLGALDLRDRFGHPIRDVLAQPKRVALLVYLAAESRRPVPRDRLLALFWPESDAEHARNALSQSLHHLRQAMGTDVIESTGATSVQLPAARLWCDAVAFGEALERGEGELALDLYRGEFCPTLLVNDVPEFDEWLEAQRQRLRRQAIAAGCALAERLAARGDRAETGRVVRRILALQPDDESDVRTLLASLERTGDSAGALLAYQEFKERLTATLEVEPAPETVTLADDIRRRRDAASRGAAAARPAEEPAGESSDVPSGSAAPAVRAARRRRLIPAAAALVALTVTTALLSRGGATVPEPSMQRVAVFPFDVRGGGRLSYLREGMVDLLSAKLNGASGFHAVDPRSVIAAAGGDTSSGSAALAAISRRLGALRYITGDVVEMAGRIQISGALFDPASGPQAVTTATVTGDTTRLFELVDDLTGRMLAGLIIGRDTALTRLGALTTTSLPALKAYLEGERVLRAGLDLQAADAFREAATLDTNFALAQYRFAMSATWVSVRGAGDNVLVTALAERAARHAQRLPPLLRDLISAYSAYKGLDFDGAERAYRRLTETYPDNVEAWFMLGECWFHYNPSLGRSPFQSRAAFERVLTLDPNNAHAQLHLARLAALEGDSTRLDSLVARYAARHGDAVRTLEMRALQAALHDQPAERRTIIRDAVGADPIMLISVLQAIVIYAQNADMGREFALPYTRSASSLAHAREYGSRILNDVPLAQGTWGSGPAVRPLGADPDADWLLESQALLAAEPLVPVPRARLVALRDTIAGRRRYPQQGQHGSQLAPLAGPAMQAYLTGLLSARLGDTAAARRSLEALESGPGAAAGDIARALAIGVRAAMARAAGDSLRALAELQRFPHSSPRLILHVIHRGVYERFAMAELLNGLGRSEEALGWYESFPAGYDLPWIAFAQLRQAQIHVKLGRPDRARFHFGRALTLWRPADPEYASLVAQARDGLARLGTKSE